MKSLLSLLFTVFIQAVVTLSGAFASPPPEPNLHLELSKAQAYPGEEVTITVVLQSNGALLRNIGYPRLLGQAIDFVPVESKEKGNASTPNRHKFVGKFRPEHAGRISIGPAVLDCETVAQADGIDAFFGATTGKQVSPSAPAQTLTVLPLPEVGRPASFSGAVGTFTMVVAADPAMATADEPITITTRIQGSGDLAKAKCPELVAPSLHGYPVKEHHGPQSLVCEQVVVPSGTVPLSKIEWSYFNPEKSRYQTETAVLFSSANAKKTKPESPEEGAFFRPFLSEWLWGFMGLAGFGIVGVFIIKLRKPKRYSEKPDTSLKDLKQFRLLKLEEAFSDNDVGKFYSELFITLQLLIGEISHRNPVSLTSAAVCYGHVTDGNYNEISDLFESCVKVRYGRRLPSEEQVNEDYHRLLRLVALSCL